MGCRVRSPCRLDLFDGNGDGVTPYPLAGKQSWDQMNAGETVQDLRTERALFIPLPLDHVSPEIPKCPRKICRPCEVPRRAPEPRGRHLLRGCALPHECFETQ